MEQQQRQPLGSLGMETDIRTGRPVSPIDKLAQKKEELAKVVAEGVIARNDLLRPGSEGNLALKGILSTLEARVEILMQADPVCTALTEILASLGAIVYRAPHVANMKLAQYLGEEFSQQFSAPKRDTRKRKP